MLYLIRWELDVRLEFCLLISEIMLLPNSILLLSWRRPRFSAVHYHVYQFSYFSELDFSVSIKQGAYLFCIIKPSAFLNIFFQQLQCKLFKDMDYNLTFFRFSISITEDKHIVDVKIELFCLKEVSPELGQSSHPASWSNEDWGRAFQAESWVLQFDACSWISKIWPRSCLWLIPVQQLSKKVPSLEWMQQTRGAAQR